MNRIAQIVSFVFHPLLMPFYCMVLLFLLPTYLDYTINFRLQLLIYAIVLITTFLMPAFSAMLLYKKGAITDLYLNNASERIAPFIITSCYYFLCYYMFRRMPVPPVMTAIILGAAVSVTLALLITFKWKISIHLIGVGGMFGMLIALSNFLMADYILPLVAVTLIAGALGTSRLISGRHSIAQIYAGFFVGSFVEFVVIKWYMI